MIHHTLMPVDTYPLLVCLGYTFTSEPDNVIHDIASLKTFYVLSIGLKPSCMIPKIFVHIKHVQTREYLITAISQTRLWFKMRKANWRTLSLLHNHQQSVWQLVNAPRHEGQDKKPRLHAWLHWPPIYSTRFEKNQACGLRIRTCLIVHSRACTLFYYPRRFWKFAAMNSGWCTSLDFIS